MESCRALQSYSRLDAANLRLCLFSVNRNFKEQFGIDVDCYVLDDRLKTAAISKRGMAQALGFSKRGDRPSGFVNSQNMEDYIGRELREKIKNPIIFQRSESAVSSISDEMHLYAGMAD